MVQHEPLASSRPLAAIAVLALSSTQLCACGDARSTSSDQEDRGDLPPSVTGISASSGTWGEEIALSGESLGPVYFEDETGRVFYFGTSESTTDGLSFEVAFPAFGEGDLFLCSAQAEGPTGGDCERGESRFDIGPFRVESDWAPGEPTEVRYEWNEYGWNRTLLASKILSDGSVVLALAGQEPEDGEELDDETSAFPRLVRFGEETSEVVLEGRGPHTRPFLVETDGTVEAVLPSADGAQVLSWGDTLESSELAFEGRLLAAGQDDDGLFFWVDRDPSLVRLRPDEDFAVDQEVEGVPGGLNPRVAAADPDGSLAIAAIEETDLGWMRGWEYAVWVGLVQDGESEFEYFEEAVYPTERGNEQVPSDVFPWVHLTLGESENGLVPLLRVCSQTMSTLSCTNPRSRTGPEQWSSVPGPATVTPQGIRYVEADADGIAVFDALEEQVGHLPLFDADPIALLDGPDGLIPIVASDGGGVLVSDWSELYVPRRP